MQTTVLITGGSKGIGLAIAEKFLSNDCKVITFSRTSGDALSLKDKYGDLLDMRFGDLSKSDSVKKLCADVLADYPKIDVLVNNAGTFLPGSIQEEADGIFELQMALNLASAYHTTRAVLPAMGEGSYIFNMCSTASIVPYINGGSYCISKHAMLGFSKVLRQELMTKGIAVSSILPGATRTESWNGTDLPDSRFMKPENVANVIFLAWESRGNCVFEELLIRPVLGDI
ncbi:MAG: SDR family oxidoreductase [Chitinophagaceae bacterium]